MGVFHIIKLHKWHQIAQGVYLFTGLERLEEFIYN